ncbi:ribonuclease H-like domain-containing protein [Tanacetum coccineum]
MDLETAQTATSAMLPILKQGPVTTEKKVQKKNDVKARSILLMALPNEHLMTFNQYKDAKTLFAAIQTRFGGNDATKKTQKTLLKKMLQKIVSQLAILGENISQEDLNLKFFRSLPSEWNTHVMVWRNKPDLDTMSFDDLYNNFKIVEQEVNRTASSSSSLSSQNMAFVSSPRSTNEVNTAYRVSTPNTQVSPASTQVSTTSTQVSTANLSDDIVYVFLASQPNGSQLVYEDLEQIHEDDIEEMDLKWRLALLSMRTRRFFQKTGRKITINGSDTVGYDKSKVECFNCHKMGHIARECSGPRNQDSRNRNQDSSRRIVNVEETSSKAMVAIDEASFDWSYMADDEVPTNMALMAFSDSKVHNDKTCLKTCLKSFETLKTQLDDLRIEFNKCEFNLATFKRGLTSVKEQLVFYKKNKVIFYEQLAVLKRDISYKDSELNMLKKEFQQPKFEGYRPKTSKSVSEDISNEVRESSDAPLVEELVSDDKLEKKTIFPTVAKIEFVRPKQQEKLVRKPVKPYWHLRIKGKGGDGPKWLFDIDVLTKSMNYVPVVADGSLFDSSSKNASNDEPQPSSDARKKDDEGVIGDQERPENSTQGVNTAGTSINTKPNMFSLGDNATLKATHADFFAKLSADLFVCENMEAISSLMVAAAKLLVLNPEEFELWKMRIEQYFLMTDYALWEVIVNGDL